MDGGSGSLVSDVVRTLEDEILGGTLLPGERLDERRLAARFGVSRTPVREALQRLAANGVVTLSSRQSASVVQLDIPDLLDSFIVVVELEALAASLAARRIMPEQREELQKANRECAVHARQGNVEGFNAVNGRFHEIIIESSHNRILRAQIRTAQLLTAPYRQRITFQPGRMVASIQEHQEIVDAILATEPEAAASRMRQHVNHLAQGASDFLHHLRPSLSKIA